MRRSRRQLFQDSGNPGQNFSSHYNATYGRCFIQVYNHDDAHTFRNVSDALEHTGYALYVESFTGGDSTLVACRVRLPNLPFVTCNSFAEWQNLVKPLMDSAGSS
jgi:hypothetical protein